MKKLMRLNSLMFVGYRLRLSAAKTKTDCAIWSSGLNWSRVKVKWYYEQLNTAC
jgi:hypothetical protein